MLTEFKKLMAARFLFTLAVQIQAIVLGWQMYMLTHDPLYLGLVGLAEAVPAISFAPVAGYIVDHTNPVKIFRLMLGVSFLSGVILFGFHLNVAGLFISSALTGMARSFSQPV